VGAFGNNFAGQDHRKREEQGRRSFLKEDDSKRN
jgi:hypothetical protein